MELLVVITIIGILIALLLPAVQSAREAARCLQCKNNLKQLAIGALNHEETHHYLPTGGWGWMWTADPDCGFGKSQPGGWCFSILPYIEQQAVYDLGTDSNDVSVTNTQDNGALLRDQTPLQVLICPTRRKALVFPRPKNRTYFNSATTTRAASIDYAANAGSKDGPTQTGTTGGPVNMAMADEFYYPAQDSTGVVFPRSEVTMASISDGTSQTYMLGEKYLCPDNYENGMDPHDDHGIYEGDSPDNIRWCTNDPVSQLLLAPMQDTPGLVITGIFGSAHSTGVHMAFCDGSVHNINYSIDPQVHDWLGGRMDGHIIDAGMY